MGYQIRYGQAHLPVENKRRYNLKWITGLCVFFVVLFLTIISFIPQFRFAIRSIILPGDPDVTAAALERLVEAVSDGEAIQTALTEFCREIIDHGLQAV